MLLTLGEEPEDFRRNGYPCLATYAEAFYREARGEAPASSSAVPLAIAAVAGLYFMSRGRRTNMRGIRARRRRRR